MHGHSIAITWKITKHKEVVDSNFKTIEWGDGHPQIEAR